MAVQRIWRANMNYQVSIIDIDGNKHLIGYYAKINHPRYIDIKILYNFDKNGYYFNNGTKQYQKGSFLK